MLNLWFTISENSLYFDLQFLREIKINIRWFLIPWKQFEVLFHNLPFSPIFIINSSSDLIKFEEIIINFLISLWIRHLFIIIPLNLRYFYQIGKFGLCFDMRPCEIDDLGVSARQKSTTMWWNFFCPISL